MSAGPVDDSADGPAVAAASPHPAAGGPVAEGPAAHASQPGADIALRPEAGAEIPAVGSAAAQISAAPTQEAEPASPAAPTSPRADPCAFCLEPLDGSNLLVLPCGHAFHAVCTLQFLLKRKRCPVCRAAVDEGLVQEATALPESSGRSFVQLAPRGSGKNPGERGTAGVIELSATPAGWAAAAAAQPGGGGPPPQRFSSDGTPSWVSDIYPARPLPPPMGILVEQPPGEPAQHGSGLTIRVVRRRCVWLKPLLLGLFCMGLLALVVSIPITMSGATPAVHATCAKAGQRRALNPLSCPRGFLGLAGAHVPAAACRTAGRGRRRRPGWRPGGCLHRLPERPEPMVLPGAVLWAAVTPRPADRWHKAVGPASAQERVLPWSGGSPHAALACCAGWPGRCSIEP